MKIITIKTKTIELNQVETNILIELIQEVNPDKQEHKDFIMKFIKELKR